MQENFFIEVASEKIEAVYHGNDDARACVISCHGMLASKDSPKYIYLADELVKHGLASIRFDFRGCGASEGSLIKSHITNRLKDLNAIMNHARSELGFEKFGLFGSSMGGFISYLKAGIDLRVGAMVTLASPYSMSELFFAKDIIDERYEIDGVVFGSEFLRDVKVYGTLAQETIAKLSCPTLIFHGTADLLVPLEHAKRLFETLTTEKMLTIIPGGDHIFSNPAHLTQIISDSTNWFEKYLR